MNQNIIIITNEEQIKSAEYTNYKDIQKAVDGTFEIYAKLGFHKANGETVTLLFFCNEEALLIDSEEMNKINAGAYLLNNETVIYGNIAVLIDAGMGEDRGFTPEETEEFVSTVKKILNNKTANCHLIHAEFDGNKPEPRVDFFSFD